MDLISGVVITMAIVLGLWWMGNTLLVYSLVQIPFECQPTSLTSARLRRLSLLITRAFRWAVAPIAAVALIFIQAKITSDLLVHYWPLVEEQPVWLLRGVTTVIPAVVVGFLFLRYWRTLHLRGDIVSSPLLGSVNVSVDQLSPRGAADSLSKAHPRAPMETIGFALLFHVGICVMFLLATDSITDVGASIVAPLLAMVLLVGIVILVSRLKASYGRVLYFLANPPRSNSEREIFAASLQRAIFGCAKPGTRRLLYPQRPETGSNSRTAGFAMAAATPTLTTDSAEKSDYRRVAHHVATTLLNPWNYDVLKEATSALNVYGADGYAKSEFIDALHPSDQEHRSMFWVINRSTFITGAITLASFAAISMVLALLTT